MLRFIAGIELMCICAIISFFTVIASYPYDYLRRCCLEVMELFMFEHYNPFCITLSFLG